MSRRYVPLTMLFALSATSLAAVEGPAAQPATPLGNPGDWVTTDDYPTEALMDNVSGITGFEVAIDKSGQVANCVVIVSSGSDSLDRATCNLVTLRARFQPAKDARGRPTTGAYRNRVRWVLPALVPQPRPMEGIVTFIVEADGTFSNCRLVKPVDPAVEAAARTPCNSGTRTTPFTDESGNPVRRRVTITQTATVDPVH